METLVEFVKVLALGVVILLLLAIAFAIIDGTINYFKHKQAKKDFENNIQNLFDDLLPEILEEIEKEEQKEKETKETKKTTRKPRKPKENKKEEK